MVVRKGRQGARRQPVNKSKKSTPLYMVYLKELLLPLTLSVKSKSPNPKI